MNNNIYSKKLPHGRIVIVDDNPENLRTLKAILDAEKYETYPAISGKLAIDAIRKVNPDVVLLDIMMPDMSGYDVCSQLKSDPFTQNIPVLFISALDDSMDKVKAFEVGGVDYISKPFRSDETLARIRTHVTLTQAQNKLAKSFQQLREHATQLETKNDELELFCHSISENLRAPLRRISGFSKIIREDYIDRLDGTGIDYFSKIENSTSQMDHQINDILHLSTISHQKFNRKQVNLSEITYDIFNNLKLNSPDRKFNFFSSENILANCDEKLIDILLTNLINNAWKFSSKLENSSIEFGSTLKNNNIVYFVRDNGIGFDMAIADKLFQPFKRLVGEKDFKGGGIGLATAQRVINLHGGRIWAEAKLNQGATFYFTLS